MGLSLRKIFTGLVLVVFTACSTGGTQVVENDEHPFPEAMFATLSSLAYPSRSPAFMQALTVYRVKVKRFGRPLPVWFWKRPAAKLTFVLLSGYGGSSDSNVLQAIAEQLWELGFSVLSLPSSTHPDFSQAASATRLPGHLPRDLNELGGALDDVKAILSAEKEPQLRESRWALAGISYGALQTLQEALSDSPHSHLNFEAFVAFNPPTRLSYAMARLDQSFNQGAPLYLQPSGALVTSMQSKIEAAQNRRLYWSETLAAFSQDELEFLLAWDFRKSLLKAISWKSTDPRSLSFETYLRQQLLPSINPPLSFEQWAALQDLRNPNNPVESKTYPHSVLVFHSLNDPLCTPGDIMWLKERLGDQMQLYRQGGHLGYVWSERFGSDLRASLVPLANMAVH
ncbi:MAG: hypothetical protein ABIR96_05135 [Bdellovibrionota bacterium]